MIKLHNKGVYLVDGKVCPSHDMPAETARKNTIAAGILASHNISGDEENLKIKFDAMVSHDITYVGIIQTARASGMKEFPLPYAMTNCHNSLCAVGGTINEDDHVFGLSAAKKYGGIYVPANQSVIHSFAREELAKCGGMILGSDSHTRYGALGTMGVGEGGPELAKQLLKDTWDIPAPEVVLVYVTGTPRRGIGPHDVAIALVGATFECGFVKNKVLEFVGPGLQSLSADFRCGIDVMTTETTCLTSIWETDEEIKKFYEAHGRVEDYKELKPGKVAYYDSMIEIDLSKMESMIALPFHPSNAYTIHEFVANAEEILAKIEAEAKAKFPKSNPDLVSKVRNGQVYADQGIIAGCAGGIYENIDEAADILRGASCGNGYFSLSVYPTSIPVSLELTRNGDSAALLEAGAVIKPSFCGPCFGAGDVPANNGLSLSHTTRNFPNREGSKPANGQIAAVALMDARSIAATAANKGYLTAATEMTDIEFTSPKYFFDRSIYENRVFDSKGVADPDQEIKMGPNIKDWPKMPALAENLVLKVVSEIHDPVTTTDELIPSGETSSYRSNPLGLAEFTLSRKDPEYVGRAKEIQKAQKAVEAGVCPLDEVAELKPVMEVVNKTYPDAGKGNIGFGSTIFAVKPGDGSAREQAASCQKVLGGWANIANEYATKRYRSNLINWGMLPFIIDAGELPFKNLDYIFIPGIKKAIEEKAAVIKAYVVKDSLVEFELKVGDLTDDERKIILDGCLINFYRN